MQARLWFTVVDIYVAQSTGHTRYAFAREIRNHIDASRAGKAWITLALVYLVTTVFTIVTWWARAFVIVNLQHNKRVVNINFK